MAPGAPPPEAPAMELEYFWAAVCWAVVVGIGALMTWVFLVAPFQHHDH